MALLAGGCGLSWREWWTSSKLNKEMLEGVREEMYKLFLYPISTHL